MSEIEKAQAEVTACFEHGNVLEDLKKVTENDRTALQARQETLKVDVPRMLVAEALGEASEGEVRELLEEMAAAEKALALIPLKLKGLKQREAENNGQHAKALNRLARLKTEGAFKATVAKLSDSYDREAEQAVRQLAHEHERPVLGGRESRTGKRYMGWEPREVAGNEHRRRQD